MPGEDYADVLVVGAGPAGLVLACELARRGTGLLQHFGLPGTLPSP